MKDDERQNTVGIRELKAKLSSYVTLVREGADIVITDRGEEVAVIVPVSPERKRILQLVSSGVAKWSGRKPEGVQGIKMKGKPLSVTVLEERV
ncbi:MAG: type II toxin-antitoxin system prevent-host-death family antitoxin [Nitrospiraceae bacterium]|nr:MAG: type II toxin-antitoxin system prevent-host-death family antitoxin [Nitrospiraceae bacterium]